MKKAIILCISIIGIILVLIFATNSNDKEEEYLRIHIRANSNSSVDQEVKYKVKDEIVESLIPILAEVETFEEAKIVVEENFGLLESIANKYNVSLKDLNNYNNLEKLYLSPSKSKIYITSKLSILLMYIYLYIASLVS